MNKYWLCYDPESVCSWVWNHGHVLMLTPTLLHTVTSLSNSSWASNMSPQLRLVVWLCLCLSWAPPLQELLQAWDKKRIAVPYHWAEFTLSSYLCQASLSLSLSQATPCCGKRSIISLTQSSGVKGKGLQLGEGWESVRLSKGSCVNNSPQAHL